MITRVRLKNWKSHLDSDMEFSGGVNVLIGVMGSGKSSVVEAISFALFGTFPGLKTRRLELDQLIMKKPDQKQHCQVELEFSVDGRNYYVKRVVDRGRGTGHAEIRRDGELLNVNARGVTDEVVRALQMDYDLFSKAVYSEQNGLDYFLRIPKGRRKDEIDRMLKVDRFEKARAEAVALRNRIRTRDEERSRLLSDMEKQDLDERLEKAGTDLSKMEKDLGRLEADLDGMKKGRDAASAAVLEAEKTEEELNQTRAVLEGASSSLNEIKQVIERMKKRFKGRNLDGINAEIKEKEARSGEMAAKIKQAEAGIDNKRSELASVNSMVKISRDGMEGIEKAGNRCPVCDSDITASKRDELMKKRKEEEKVLMSRAKAIAEELGRIAGERDKLNEGRKELELDIQKLKAAAAEFADMAGLEKRKEQQQARKKEAGERMKALEKRLKATGLEKLRKRKEELAAKESGLRAKIAGTQERLSDKRSVFNELNERRELMNRYRNEAERDGRIIGELGGFEKALKVTQDQLREEFLKTVNSIMADVWAELYPYGDFQDIRLAIEDDYVLQLKESREWVSVEGAVSGGERSMATLTLRVAFSMAFLPNLKWLMLDEPTHNLDANAIRQFASILREKMGMFAEQVFLITHEERISEGVTGQLYRMERDKDKDEPTRIRPL